MACLGQYKKSQPSATQVEAVEGGFKPKKSQSSAIQVEAVEGVSKTIKGNWLTDNTSHCK